MREKKVVASLHVHIISAPLRDDTEKYSLNTIFTQRKILRGIFFLLEMQALQFSFGKNRTTVWFFAEAD